MSSVSEISTVSTVSPVFTVSTVSTISTHRAGFIRVHVRHVRAAAPVSPHHAQVRARQRAVVREPDGDPAEAVQRGRGAEGQLGVRLEITMKF